MDKKKDATLSMSRSNFGGRGWVVMILVGLSIFLQSSIINDSLNVTIPEFAKTYGWNINTLYMLSTITAWVAVPGAALWASLSLKSAKRTWILTLAIAAVALVFWSFATQLWMYIVALLVVAIMGQGFNYTASYTVINNWFPRKKGLAMGWVTIGFPISAMMTTPLMQMGIIPNLGLQGAYLFYTVLAVVLMVLIMLFVKDFPEQAGKYPDNDKSLDRATLDKELAAGIAYAKTSPWTPQKLIKTGNVWRIGATFGVFGLVSIGVMTNFMPRALQGGYTPDEVIPMLMVTGLTAAVGSYLCGVLDAKVGPKKASIITMFLAVAALLINIIPSKVAMYISLPMIGVLLGGSSNYLVSITTTVWGRYDFPNAYRILIPIHAFVAALGVSIIGIIGNTVNYTVAYLVVAGIALIAALVMFGIKDHADVNEDEKPKVEA